eukprot:456763-Rhodomonas_salina.3
MVGGTVVLTSGMVLGVEQPSDRIPGTGSAIYLRACYAMSGTDIAPCLLSVFGRPTPCPVLRQRIVLPGARRTPECCQCVPGFLSSYEPAMRCPVLSVVNTQCSHSILPYSLHYTTEQSPVLCKLLYNAQYWRYAAQYKAGSYTKPSTDCKKPGTEPAYGATTARTKAGRGRCVRALQPWYHSPWTALEKAGEYKAAVKAYREAIELEPEEAKYYNNMGGSLAAYNRTETAERSYKWAIKLKPKCPAPLIPSYAPAMPCPSRAEIACDAVLLGAVRFHALPQYRTLPTAVAYAPRRSAVLRQRMARYRCTVLRQRVLRQRVARYKCAVLRQRTEEAYGAVQVHGRVLQPRKPPPRH